MFAPVTPWRYTRERPPNEVGDYLRRGPMLAEESIASRGVVDFGSADVAEWLSKNRWSCTVVGALDLMAQLGGPAAPGVDTTSMRSNFIAAWLTTPKAGTPPSR